MKRKRQYNSKIGKLLFILPAIIIIVIVVYAFVALNAPGTLVVRAELANGTLIHVPAAVNGNPLTTPSNLSLARGTYTAEFSTVQWYYTPASETVTIAPGLTQYAIGLYQPQVRFIQVTQSGFNFTSLSVMHGINPVTWTNPSGTTVAFSGGPFQQVTLAPGKSYTYTFAVPGNYEFAIISTNETLGIQVK